MNGMSWCHGWQVATNVQDERYVVVPWMASSDECSGWPFSDILYFKALVHPCTSTVMIFSRQIISAYVDVGNVLVPWMAKNAYVQDVTLIQKQVQHDEVFRINNRHPEFISGSSLCI
jgi:hypothetical protein